MLVWQDMPSLYWEEAYLPTPSPAESTQWQAELASLIRQHLGGFPCIVVYVIFNEAWGQHDTLRIVSAAKVISRAALQVIQVVSCPET